MFGSVHVYWGSAKNKVFSYTKSRDDIPRGEFVKCGEGVTCSSQSSASFKATYEVKLRSPWPTSRVLDIWGPADVPAVGISFNSPALCADSMIL